MQQEAIKLHNEKLQRLENESNIRQQIVEKELTLEQALLVQKAKDKDQVDAIVSKIISEEMDSKDKLFESMKKQFSNMVDSLWLKQQNIKKEKQLEQQAFEDAMNFQLILDQREKEKLTKEQAANEFKDKV